MQTNAVEVDPGRVEDVMAEVLGLPLAYDEAPEWLLLLAQAIAQALPPEDECVD